MTTSAKPIFQSWIPRGRGKGGEFSNSTPYDSDADTLVSVLDLVIETNSWVPRPAEMSPGALFGVTGQTAQWRSPVVAGQTYIYNSIALANYYLGGPSLYTGAYGSCSYGGSSLVRLIDPISSVVGYTGTTLRTVSSGNKWVFRFIKNRMYMCNGNDRPMISSEPQSQLVGVYPSVNTYPWGVTAPVTPMTYNIATGSITAGSLTTVTNGSTAVVGLTTTFTSAAVGQTIFILGVPYTIVAITDNTHLTLDRVYEGTTGAVANGAWQINTGNLSWEPGAGFLYSYAYYDPVSGHVSNMAPLLYVNDGPPNNVGVSVVLNNIDQLLNATGLAPDPRFTDIVIYRTAHGGGVLFPLAVLSNSAASPPYTYTDTQNDDTQLGSVGPGAFPGPFTTNHPPPNDLNFTAYWDGRFWGFSSSQPGLLFFSARVDSTNSEIPVGVAEECWPLQNTVPIPDTDGSGTGLRVVGSNLMVLTTRGIYAVAGGSPASYRLSKITTKGNGTSHFATCALPGEDANSAEVLVHVGNDLRIYFLYGAGGDVSYSYPIQDQIFTSDQLPANHYLVEILHNSQGAYLLFVGSGGYTHAYDMERQVWFTWTLGWGPGNGTGVYALCEGLIFSRNQFLIANSAGIWALQPRPSPSLSYAKPYIQTQRFSPPGVERFDTKQLSEMFLYDIADNTTWVAWVQADAKAILGPSNATTDTTTRSILGEPSELYYPRTSDGTLAQGRTFRLTFSADPPQQSGVTFKLSEIKSVWVNMTDNPGAPK